MTASLRSSLVVLSTAALAVLSGCVSYERKPLDLDTVRDIYDEVLLLNRKPLAFGPVAEVFTGEQIEKTFAAGVAGGKERA